MKIATLAERQLNSGEKCLLQKIVNRGNERLVFKKSNTLLWFFTSIYEKEDGDYVYNRPPYNLDSNYERGIDELMKLIRIT